MNAPARTGGFTLIEVMVALIVTTIGLLGIAKVQALAYASTGSASVRSLVATEAAGLATAMRANRGYWAAAPTAAPITIDSSGISNATLNTTAASSTFASNYCAQGGGGAPCPAATLAASDLHIWFNALSALLPTANTLTTITCPAGVIPLSCTIRVDWTERTVAVNATGAAANVTQTYKLYVQP